MTGVSPVFLDTNVLVAASVEGHPGHGASRDLLRRIAQERVATCISPQVCREFLVVLTRGPVEGRDFSTEEALDSLRPYVETCTLLSESDDTADELQRLIQRRMIRGSKIHDANIVATMRVHDVDRLATLDVRDFARFEEEISLEPVTS